MFAPIDTRSVYVSIRAPIYIESCCSAREIELVTIFFSWERACSIIDEERWNIHVIYILLHMGVLMNAVRSFVMENRCRQENLNHQCSSMDDVQLKLSIFILSELLNLSQAVFVLVSLVRRKFTVSSYADQTILCTCLFLPLVNFVAWYCIPGFLSNKSFYLTAMAYARLWVWNSYFLGPVGTACSLLHSP
jgi:hypothetical protein